MEAEQKPSVYKRYVAEIDLYEKLFKPWVTRSNKIVKLYKDSNNSRGKNKRFNVLWSNVQTLQPALYARDPNPVAERRFKDSDPVGRTASEILERCISYTLDSNAFGQVMRQAVTDRLLPGRGVLWNRYDPSFSQPEQLSDDAEAAEELEYERVITDYVFWEDFGHVVARTWEEVPAVWRRVYMDRAALVKRFGPVGQKIPLNNGPKNLKDKSLETLKKACIYEIWDRTKGEVLFLCRDYPEIIDSRPDPLGLTNSFPCAKPIYATLTNDELVPVPDYALYQTQAKEIEDLTARIDALQQALKVAGVYDSSAPELSHILNDGYENKMVPVARWSEFAEKGGIGGSVDFLPIKEIADTLLGLYEAREKSKADLYEITGIADIIRGNSDPRETAAAQQYKGRFAVLRISDSQEDVQRFARDNIRIIGEIIAEHFELKTIQQISGVKLLTQEQKGQIGQLLANEQTAQTVPEEMQDLMREPTWDEVYDLLQNDVLRNFRIDIETDSTIRTDEEADRRERTEFLTAAGNYISQAVEAGQTSPELAPLLGEMLMFGIRGHRAARGLETTFDDALREMRKPKPPQPNPEMAKVEANMQLEEKKLDAKVAAEDAKQRAQHEEELARQKMEDQRAERDAVREMEKARLKAELDKEVSITKINAEANAKVQVARIQAEVRQQEMDFEDRSKDRDRASAETGQLAEREKAQGRQAVLSEVRELMEGLKQFRELH